ncbi:DNA replication/repair protein RecF [Acidihalobacter aeolianus]|uniref:DNA replication/repair protein RecF n=1 Tax=Acidihalobacter aeolianus TaxID=2792603 RepID=UPI0009F34C13|nr:DNA replication/repair protein RecF [Acidihalobacter aeolianus]
MLTEISFSCLRNLREQTFLPGGGVNLIVGRNAAGKTSVLEAIYLLSRGRSFRTTQLDSIVCSNGSSCWVRGRVQKSPNERNMLVAYQRSGRRNRFRIDGDDANGIAQLAKLLPVQVIQPDSHLLITGGPGYRRAYVDWGCFYSDSAFYPAWLQYRRSLSQYNSALRQNSPTRVLESLEAQLSSNGFQLAESRQRYIDTLSQKLPTVAELWPDFDHSHIDYDQGWPADMALDEALARQRERSLRIGSALVGAHRAELKILVDNLLLSQSFSRGHIKRVTYALILAQVSVFEDTAAQSCCLLIDDVSSELDVNSLRSVADVLSHRQSQTFITALESDCFDAFEFAGRKMFHVEHGVLSELV